MTPAAVVIGIGNPFRRDDGLGPAVVARLRDRVAADVVVTENDGDTAELVDLWDGVPLAVVVDAVRVPEAEPGRIHRLEPDGLGAAGTAASTHGLGLGEAVDLAAALGRLPERLVVYVVEATDFTFGPEMSEAVAGAVDHVVEHVLSDVTAAPA